jgi:hypothetical protein
MGVWEKRISSIYVFPVGLTNELYKGQRLSHAAATMSFSLMRVRQKSVLTGFDVCGRHVRKIFGENNSQTPTTQAGAISITSRGSKSEENILIQMPVDVTVEEPRARVVGAEADGDEII